MDEMLQLLLLMLDSEDWTLQHCSILQRAPHCTQLSRLLCSAKLNFMMHFARPGQAG